MPILQTCGWTSIELKFTTLLPLEGGLVAYQYPLKTGQTPRETTGDFTLIFAI